MRFAVFAAEFRFTNDAANYYNNYYRQEQIVSVIEWAGGKKLPAFSAKHPNLYILAAKGEKSMSVLLINVFPDDVDEPVITLDKAYKNIKFAAGGGILKEDKVYLSDITSYGFAAFEVEE